MTTPFLGQIMMAGFNFAPIGWAACDGQLLSIEQHTALFSLLGTFYGGDGRSTFGLPNLQGSVPIGAGQGPGLSPYFVGDLGGSATETLNGNEMPAHNHPLVASTNVGTSASPVGALPAVPNALPGYQLMYAAPGSNVDMNLGMMAPIGENLPHNNMMPYVVMNFVIALSGIFPSRN